MNQSTTSLIGAVFLLEIGSALQGVLLPVRAEMAGFQAETIGAMGTLYYAGFVFGCLRLPAMIRRIGHIRSYAALSAMAASLVLMHALVIAPLAWMGLRVVAGFCFAGLFMVTESWINDRGTPETRGRIFGRYMLATWFGVIFGKLVYSVALPDAFHLFALASIAVALSMVPLTVTNGAMPVIPQPTRMQLAEAFRTAPIGFLGCLAVGLANSAFWTFGPLFASNEIGPGLPVSLFMAFCVLGGAVAQWPVGRLSDQTDRRWVILGLCIASIAVSLSIAFAHETRNFGLYGRGAIFGAATLSLYSICVAYANDRADPASYVDVSGHLLLVFGVGAIAGPFLAGVLVSAHGYPSLFLFMAGAESLLALLVLVGVFAAAPVPREERAVFASQPPLSHGTQAAIPLQQDTDPAKPA